MLKRTILTVIMLASAVIHYGQEVDRAIESSLVSAGFENIRVTGSDSARFVSFENNIYRWQVRALATALDSIAGHSGDQTVIHLVQLRYDIPQVVTSISAGNWLLFRNDSTSPSFIDTLLHVSYKTEQAWDQLRKQKAAVRNIARFDLVFYPQFYLANLTFEKVYEIQFNIAPALEVSFWRGMLLTAQVIFPLYNDCLVYGEGGNKIRPGFLVLSQDFRLPGPLFGKISIGNFNYNRYGGDLKLNYPFRNPRWYIGMNAGITGYSVFTGSGWELGDLNTLTFSLHAGYFLPRFNLRFEGSAGRYIQGDFGGRFDLSRMFGETTIGLYASFTTLDNIESGQPNAGFHIAVPFPPGKRFRRKIFRADLPDYFDWEYNGATEFYYGRYYEVRPDENRTGHYFNPLYIKNELIRNRHYK